MLQEWHCTTTLNDIESDLSPSRIQRVTDQSMSPPITSNLDLYSFAVGETPCKPNGAITAGVHVTRIQPPEPATREPIYSR